MLRAFLMIGAALATVSCRDSRSDTLGKFGDYRKVEGAWRERTDSWAGLDKSLSYDLWSDDDRATLSLGCFDKRFTAAVSMNGARRMAFDTKAVVELRRDRETVRAPFVVLRGEKELRPGRATSDDAEGFITSLSGKQRLGFKIRSVMGIATADLPLGFDVQGAKAVAHNLDVACHKAG